MILTHPNVQANRDMMIEFMLGTDTNAQQQNGPLSPRRGQAGQKKKK